MISLTQRIIIYINQQREYANNEQKLVIHKSIICNILNSLADIDILSRFVCFDKVTDNL